jgi:catechol 2,3-dioxygenase-like lactoylglutathione lyase family enzyme
MDLPTLTSYYGNDGRWFDDTRTKVRGLDKISVLPSAYWKSYDRTSQGLQAELDVSLLRVRGFGSLTLVSYAQTLEGNGAHPFRDVSLVTHLFDNPGHVAYTLVVSNDSTGAMAKELDYTGYPISNLAAAKKFYERTMRLGQPYHDTAYWGYWSNNAVFGIYQANPVKDGIPVPNQANGYVSFWVHSARDTYNYLKTQGATFPVIPSINTVSGVDPQPGYTQVFATDSEGVGVIFTEYSGR